MVDSLNIILRIAMSSNLALTFSQIYTRVSDKLGIGTSPTGTDLTKVKDITYRGYRRFLFPLNMRTGRAHAWSFLKQEGQIDLTVGVYRYPLPTDFQWFYYPPTYGPDANYPNPQPVTMTKMMELRSFDSSNNYPFFWALNTMKFEVTVGTRYEIQVHPVPNSIQYLHYGYLIEPDKPTQDDEYFIGGAAASECILECALAEGQAQEDDAIDIHDARAKDKLQTCIEMDLRRTPTSVGTTNNAERAFWNDPALAQASRWIDAATTAYGIS